MAFWRGERLLAEGPALITPFCKSQIDCNAYTLRMGGKYFRTSDGTPGSEKAQKKQILSSEESLTIPPGQFAYLLTKETVKIPANAMAFISMRTQLKFEGLINVSGFHVDPGYEGKLLYAVFNAGPSAISISENERPFKIWFCDLERLKEGQVASDEFWKKPGEGVYDIDNRLIHGMSPPIVSLQGMAEELRAQERSLETLDNAVKAQFEAQKPTLDTLNTFYRTIIASVTAGVILAIMFWLYSLFSPTAQQAGAELKNWIFPAAVAPAIPAAKPGSGPAQPKTNISGSTNPKIP